MIKYRHLVCTKIALTSDGLSMAGWEESFIKKIRRCLCGEKTFLDKAFAHKLSLYVQHVSYP